MALHSPNALEAMLSELGDFTPHIGTIVEQSGEGGVGSDICKREGA
jgi:hypothetical protein